MSTFIDRDAAASGGGGASYTEDTAVLTLTGVVGTVTATAQIIKIGNFVNLAVPQIVGATSNAAGKTLTGLPAAYRPLRNYIFFTVPGLANSIVGGAIIQASGVIQLSNFDPAINTLSNSWPTSGSILFNGMSFCYPII